MYLCEDGHTEIAHDDGYKNCPLCKAIEENNSLLSEISELKEKISDLEDTIIELENSNEQEK